MPHALPELHRLDGSSALELIKSNQITVEDYVQALIKRIEERDPVVKGWAHFNQDEALAQARALDALPADKRGPLHGLPVAVKDVILTKDMPTQYNSAAYVSKAPIAMDAACIMTLRSSGALILGKTTTTEFATCQRGPLTTNPHDSTRTAGGSSSGSGAVVGDFQCPISLGTQTGGSTIRPGSFNGIYALKPTWNSISREGLKIYSLTCDTLGLYARSVADLKLLAEVFRLEDDVTPPAAPLSLKGAKFGFAKTHVWPRATEGTRNAWEKAKELLKEEGAEVEEIDLGPEFEEIWRLYPYVLAGEGRSAFLGDYLTHPDVLDPLILSHVRNDTKITRAQQLEGYDKIAALRPKLDAIAARYDALVTPSTTDEAIKLEEPNRFTGDASFNLMWTVLQVPVMNIPGFKGPSGCPLGLSLVAPRYHEQKLLRVGEAVGQVWGERGGWKSAL
ncbi:amidase [Rhodotorula paludigena]|uniref:amidase n=1 Tax=Rhodotorula paludigena TaxID=86838 RepID=UPI00317BDC29